MLFANSVYLQSTAQVAKLVDALCSGRSAARCAGSNPVLGTNPSQRKEKGFLF